MDVREKLVEILLQEDDLCERGECKDCFANGSCYYYRVADRLIANGVTVQEWVSVKDRLPDWRDGKVLVFTKYGFSICERTVNNRWQGQHANWITHWCRLPKPLK